MVGDYRQLDAIGPGSALEALASRHPGHVFALTENVRQCDPAERHALDQLRAGDVPMAVAWYYDPQLQDATKDLYGTKV